MKVCINHSDLRVKESIVVVLVCNVSYMRYTFGGLIDEDERLFRDLLIMTYNRSGLLDLCAELGPVLNRRTQQNHAILEHVQVYTYVSSLTSSFHSKTIMFSFMALTAAVDCSHVYIRTNVSKRPYLRLKPPGSS